MTKILEFLTRTDVLVFLGVGIILIVAALIFLRLHKKSLIKKVHELEVSINALRSIPLTPKINKAVGLAKVNDHVVDRVNQAQEDFIGISNAFDRLVHLLGNAEDELLTGKISEGKQVLAEIEGLYQKTSQETNRLNDALDTLLEDENRLRADINNMKNEFRTIKTEYESKLNSLSLANSELEHRLDEIALLFDDFERWMYGSQYDEAQTVYVSIQDAIAQFRTVLYNLPTLIEKATGLLPNLIEEVEALNQECLSRGVFLSHLEITKNIDFIQSGLKQDKINLGQLELDEVSDRLDGYHKRLNQLLESIRKENEAFDKVASLKVTTSSQQEQVSQQLTRLVDHLPKLKDRFGFNDLVEDMPSMQALDQKIQVETRRLNEKVSREKVPYTSLLLEFSDLAKNIHDLLTDLQSAYKLIQSARQDEQRAHQQVLRLSLLLNDIRVKVNQRHLPQIAQTYQGDMVHASQRLQQIRQILGVNPLNIPLLNGAVNEAIDQVYKLYNNVNNLIGTVDMAENAIVYGNKFRSQSSELDSDLTRAEISFRNGEYTPALDVAIIAINKFKPGTSYEELITQNAQSG